MRVGGKRIVQVDGNSFNNNNNNNNNNYNNDNYNYFSLLRLHVCFNYNHDDDDDDDDLLDVCLCVGDSIYGYAKGKMEIPPGSPFILQIEVLK